MGPFDVLQTLARPSGEVRIVEVIGGFAEKGNGRFAEGDKPAGGGVAGGGVGELLDEDGDGRLVSGRLAALVEEVEEGGAATAMLAALRVCASAEESAAGGEAGEAGSGPAGSAASSRTSEPTDITEDSVVYRVRVRSPYHRRIRRATGGKKQ